MTFPGFALRSGKVMRKHWIWCLICAVFGLLLAVCGLGVPAHLRAVDISVLQEAGAQTPGLIEQGLTLVRQNKLGAAQLLLRAAADEGVPDRDEGMGRGRGCAFPSSLRP